MAKRISYAASFGRTVMMPEIKMYYAKHLKRYNTIAVREDSAVELMEKLGIRAEQVVDPTLLLSADEWRKISIQKSKRKYILVYQLHNDPKLGEYAQKVAADKKLPLLRISDN